MDAINPTFEAKPIKRKISKDKAQNKTLQLQQKGSRLRN